MIARVILCEILDYAYKIADVKYNEHILNQLNKLNKLNKGDFCAECIVLPYAQNMDGRSSIGEEFRIKEGEHYLTICINYDGLGIIKVAQGFYLNNYRLEYADPKFFDRLFEDINESSYLQIVDEHCLVFVVPGGKADI